MRIRLGYQLSITMLFVFVVLGVGLALVYLSFDRAKAISRSAAVTYIDRVAEHTADTVDQNFATVLQAVEVVKQFPSIQMGTISADPQLYALMAALLREHKQLYNIYVGYDDGSFIELDALDRAGPAVRAQLGAPEQAVFRLVIIAKRLLETGGNRHTTFLSADLWPVSDSWRPADYDPRIRPWYRDAFEAGAGNVTDPYVFKVAALAGYTVRVPFAVGRRGVVAGDILLRDIDAFLRTQKLGKSGVVFLFDDQGRVIAHPRMTEFIHQNAAGELELPRLEQVEAVDIRGPLKASQENGSAPQVFEASDGRTYVAAFRPIDSAGSAKLRIAVMAPLDEFFSEIEAQRWQLFALALALVAATLPVVWGLGLIMARSMRSLAAETDRIRHFELADPATAVRSPIREIDELAQSVATMRTVVRAFSSFIPRRLVQQLIESGAEIRLGGARRELTVMFTDIEGFTNIAEHADPEKVMLYTSRYLAALSAVIMAHNGTVDKFVGDAIMAIWNAPADDPDHVTNACSAALACRRANDELNAAFEQEGWPAYRTRFGLHTGEAVVGNIGSEDRMNYTVLGATVNMAAKLEPLNKEHGTEILVSETVARRAAEGFDFRFVTEVNLKGFGNKVRVYELQAKNCLTSRRSSRP